MSNEVTGVTQMRRNKPTGKLYEVRGEWKTMSEWSKLSGIPSGTLGHRIKSMGLTMEQAIAHEPHKYTKPRSGARLIEIDGVSKTLDAWSMHVGIDPTTIRRRLLRGMSLRDAITTEADATKQQSAFQNGSMLAEVAHEFGVTKQAIQQMERRSRTHIKTGWVVKHVDKWCKRTGTCMSDDAIASIVAHVLGSDSVWEALDKGDLDVADLCRAAKRMEMNHG